MIVTVEEFKALHPTTLPDSTLSMIIEGVESFVVQYTNNDFVNRNTGEVDYPVAVKIGAIHLANWEIEGRNKVGVSSETISRHSVSYDSSAFSGSSSKGYPGSLLGFLYPWMKARF